MLKGLPASGKSTHAKELIKNNGYKRVNKDELRRMIDDGQYSPDKEFLIKDIQDRIIVDCNNHNFNVVVDNTNLKPEDEVHLRSLASRIGMDFEIVRFITPVDECVHRDSLRGSENVGAQVIYDMYERYMK